MHERGSPRYPRLYIEICTYIYAQLIHGTKHIPTPNFSPYYICSFFFRLNFQCGDLSQKITYGDGALMKKHRDAP